MDEYKLYIVEHILESGLKDRELEEKASLNRGDLKNIKRGSLPNPIKLQQLFKDGLGKSIEEAFYDPYSEIYKTLFNKENSDAFSVETFRKIEEKNTAYKEKNETLTNELNTLKNEKAYLHEKLAEYGEKYSKILEELLDIQRKANS